MRIHPLVASLRVSDSSAPSRSTRQIKSLDHSKSRDLNILSNLKNYQIAVRVFRQAEGPMSHIRQPVVLRDEVAVVLPVLTSNQFLSLVHVLLLITTLNDRILELINSTITER